MKMKNFLYLSLTFSLYTFFTGCSSAQPADPGKSTYPAADTRDAMTASASSAQNAGNTAKGEWSHNQGLAGDFWPYDLYQYNPASDTYELAGMVDAWDKNFAVTDSGNNPFPDNIDSSGTGFVYYIMTDGQYDTSHPVDAADYNAWLASYIGHASECQIEFQKLTPANISQIK